MAQTSRSSSTLTVAALGAIVLLVAVVLIVKGYGGASFWPGLVAGFLGTLVAFVLALAWERERASAEVARQARELYEQRETETKRRLEPVRGELSCYSAASVARRSSIVSRLRMSLASPSARSTAAGRGTRL